MSVGEAEHALSELFRERPELAASQRTRYMRGTQFYPAKLLPRVFCNAAGIFRRAHGREPDLLRMPTTADHFFALKFFHDIPVSPSPGDKLASAKYLPENLRPLVGVPRRVWASEDPDLPEEGQIPAGHYWLKCSTGNAMQERVSWPPSAEKRAELRDIARGWMGHRYGLAWGEWWYSLTKPRLFLEEDLAPLLKNRPEYRIFVRHGAPQLILAARKEANGVVRQSFFDNALNRLEGRHANALPLDTEPPETIGAMLKAAAAIGKHFHLVRIDFLNTVGSRPFLGELTLCHVNANRLMAPPAFDEHIRHLLFE